MDIKFALLLVILVLLLWHLFVRQEHFTMIERVAILERRVDALYSGGSGIRGKSIPTSANQN